MTETEIREAKFAEKKRYKLYDIEGLYLIVGKKSKRWYVRYTYSGKRCDMPLGRYPFVSLLEARGKLCRLSHSAKPLKNCLNWIWTVLRRVQCKSVVGATNAISRTVSEERTSTKSPRRTFLIFCFPSTMQGLKRRPNASVT